MKEVLITSSVLIAALLLLRSIFAKKVRRTWIYGAWLLVALRLLIPVQIGVFPISVLTVTQPLTETVEAVSGYRVFGQNEREANIRVVKDYIEQDQQAFTPQVQEYIRKAQEAGTPAEEIAAALVKTQGDTLYAPEIQAQAEEKVDAQTRFVSLGALAKTVWLIGVAVMVIWLAAGNLRLGNILRDTGIAVACDVPIPVYISDAAVSPCLVGLFRPAVYLTPESASDETVMRHVLAHELTHYAHKDHIWALVRCVCLCVYWFDPLVWAAAWFSRRDCELACDEGALKRLGEEERIAYGKSLLQVVSQAVLPGRLMLTATTMAETKKQLKERVEFIVKRAKMSVAATVCMVLVCALIAGCVVSGPADPATKKSWEVTEEVRAEIKQDYVESMSYTNHSCTAEDVELVMISHVDAGYAMAISCKCGSVKADASWDDLHAEDAGDLLFYMPDGWFIQFWKDGEFHLLNAAYNLKWMDYQQLRQIWDDYHAQFPKALEVWKQVNAGVEAPPERDPSGLNYTVNEDGKTCTVTGMGVCNDTELVIPTYIDGYQVTAIGRMAFCTEIRITSVTMPDSVISIGRSAFADCEQLKSVTFSTSLETIGIHAFEGCKALELIYLPDSLTCIDGGAFSNCGSLTTVTIPAGVTNISSGVFRGCKNLMVLGLPSGITDIGEYALAGCAKLEIIEFKGKTAQWEAINKMDQWLAGAPECHVFCLDGTIIENEA